MKIHFKLSSAIFIVSGPVWWLLLFSSRVPLVSSGPLNIEGPSREVANNSLTDFDLPSVSSKGCRYKALIYSNGEEVSTDEPCLACQCKGTVVVCKLRICPEIPDPPPPGCIVVHKAKSCCSLLICQENPKKISREQRFPLNISNETLLASMSTESKESAGYCVLDGTVYAEGSAMRSSTLCQYCFCIRGEMKCSSPQCVIPLNGCKPKFRSYACCPTNYDCGESNETAVLKTLPSSTQVPQFLKGCLVNNQFVPEGEPVLPVHLTAFAGNSSSTSYSEGSTNVVCQTCFCMGGVVHCRPLECDQPIDGCEPIKEDGHCCPDRYDCSKPSSSKKINKQQLLAVNLSTAIASPYSHSVTIIDPVMTTTEFSVGEEAEATTDEGVAVSDYYVPVAISTMRGIVIEEEDVEPTTETTPSVVTITTTMKHSDLHHRSNANEDSFERVATIISGSSEESTSIIPPTTTLFVRDDENGVEDKEPKPKKKTRISSTNVGGFQNRSDLGSREERRSKDGDEMKSKASNKQLDSVEDDEREEYYGYPMFEETTMSNAIADNLGEGGEGTTTEFTQDIIPESTFHPDETESAGIIVDREDGEATENNLISDQEFLQDTTIGPRYLANDDLVTTVLTDDETTEKIQEQTSENPGTASSKSISTEDSMLSTTEHSTSTEDAPSSTTEAKLEFIPFVEEDALLPLDNNSQDNDTAFYPDERPSSHETDGFDKLTHGLYSFQDSILSLLKPLQLKFFNSTTEESFVAQGSTEIDDHILPILVEEDDERPTEFNLENNNSSLGGGGTPFNLGPPGSSSLYNNGYFPHGSIIKDDEDSPAHELHVSEGQMDDKEESENTATTLPPPPSTTTKKPEVPLKAISSFDKFIPSYAPATEDPNDNLHPSRTYSKFGIQDAPLYHRYENHGPVGSAAHLDNTGFAYPSTSNRKPATTGIYHHRYFNEPEEIPTSRIQNPYNFYNTNTNQKNGPTGGGGGHSQQGILGMLPPYKNNQFFYEDSSAALDSYEDYDTYISPPPSSNSNIIISSTPTPAIAIPPRKSSTPKPDTSSTNFQFLGERVRLPSYNQQRATSTPKYKYAYVNNRGGGASAHTTSSYYFKNNKLMTTQRTTPHPPQISPNEYSKPYHAPFPFSLPRSQDDENNLLKSLGIKLSGCNVVGKMYSVGEVIDELSSECLRCMCSDIGVHCAERKC